jgi:hypothetical protein
MQVLLTSAPQHFAGFSEKEGLSASNTFVCPACEAGASFPHRVLSAAAGARLEEAPRRSKLQATAALAFEKPINEFVSMSKARFALDFHCPKCQRPYAIGFEWTELHMADTRYFPVSLWSAVE